MTSKEPSVSEVITSFEPHGSESGGQTSPTDSLFSVEAGDEQKSLADRINDHLVKSAYDHKHFLPEGSIEELLTKDAVREELSCPPASATTKKYEDQVISFIFAKEDGAKKLFVIALLCGIPKENAQLLKAMIRFQKAGISDSSLPLNPDGCLAFSDGKRVLSPWNSVRVSIFGEKQWTVLAPVFTDKNTKLAFDANHILPTVGEVREGETGAFGEVVQITMHEKHWSKPILRYDGQRADIAVKKIIKSGRHTSDQEKLDQLQKEWDREVAVHIAMRQAQHPNIIEFIAAVERDHDRFLMFRWAEEGNLRKFWETNTRPVLTTTLVKDAVYQIIGLADALHKLHTGNYRTGGESFRHGDLKPENILCVTIKPRQHDGTINMPELKISDMGLAKHHNVATELRPPTSMRYTTTRYEPPEVISTPDFGQGRSRRYDMWSLGCVILETIIWLLYGNKNLETFNSKIVDEMGQKSHWFEFEKGRLLTASGHRGQAVVHHNVQNTMRTLGRDQECARNTAMGDLLAIVRTKLLVVKLGAGTTIGDAGPKSSPGCRIYSEELLECLDEMVRKGESDGRYWFTGKSRHGIDRLIAIPDPESPIQQTSLSPQAALARGQRPPRPPEVRVQGVDGWPHAVEPEEISLSVPAAMGAITRRDEYRNAVQVDKTEFPVDNKFAGRLLAAPGNSDLFPTSAQPARLCDKCQKLDLCEPMFHIVDVLSELESSRSSCDFCKMRWEACHHLNKERVQSVRFDRDQSILRLNEGLLPVLSICRSPDYTNPNSHVIQIGLPRIAETASPSHLSILRQWISECDDNHPDCHPRPTKPVTRPPTRLIDVGTKDAPLARVFETQPSTKYKYIALSHPWGPPPHFCTFPSTLAQHKQRIPVEGPDFPDTFRHAIATTRELGLRHLWIDSICIIQGPEGDFGAESKRMEDVFSSAYCVIAASSARGQRDGFLGGRRKERQFLRLAGADGGGESGKGGLYVCRFIDNFGEHVLNSPLSKRGWVLQERALARRTIYFTDWQAYWECGDGVRCETLTKVDNKLASFLGDPNFPSKLSGNVADRGEKIRFYEDLYYGYSRLDFTRVADRSFAIAGLEQRMVRDLQARGGFGIFDDGRSLLPRSLLWRRGKEVKGLTRIHPKPEELGEGLRLPSWTWMAYKGAIDFLDLPLGGVDWQEDEIHGPWKGGEPMEEAIGKGLSAVARPFQEEPVDTGEGDFEILLDARESAGAEGWQDWKCVVVGTKRIPKGVMMPMVERTHYLLLIAAASTDGGDFYTRIGVGKMTGVLIGPPMSSRVTVH